MKRFDCMERLGGLLKDELVVLSLRRERRTNGTMRRRHMRAASLFQQQLGASRRRRSAWRSACHTVASCPSIRSAASCSTSAF